MTNEQFMELEEEIKKCNKCGLGKRCNKHVVWAYTTETPRVVFLGIAPGCFTGDTKISLLDGTEKTFFELARENLDDAWVYSCTNDGLIQPGRVKRVWKTGVTEKIYKIKLDNECVIKCTENHPFMLRDGTYRSAVELTEGNSLMPLYRDLNERGYEIYFDNKMDKWKHTHYMNIKAKRRYVVHHKELNKRDNRPTKLEMMLWTEHGKLHRDIVKNRVITPEIEKKLLEQCTRGRAKFIERWKKDPALREKYKNLMTKRNLSKAYQIKCKDGMRKKLEEDPHLRERVKKQLKKNVENGRKTLVNRYIKTCQQTSEKCLELLDIDLVSKELGVEKLQIYRRLKKTQDKEITPILRENKKKKLHDERTVKETRPQGICSCGCGQITGTRKYREVKSLMYLLGHNLRDKWKFDRKNMLKRGENRVRDNLGRFNHKIMKIEIESGKFEVYDMEIEDYHNFALTAGVFVHNSTEDRLGLPFVGRSGKLLMSWIKELELDEWGLLNLLKCHTPTNRTPRPYEIETCRPFLDRQLDLLKPEIVVCLGQTPTRAMGFDNKRLLRNLGKIHFYKEAIKMICFVHPSYCLRFPNYIVPLDILKKELMVGTEKEHAYGPFLRNNPIPENYFAASRQKP